MKHLYTLLFFVLLVSFPSKMAAVSAYPFPVEFKQPNGETITIQMHGDEYFHYATTADGYLIAYDKSGYFMYALINEKGMIVPGPVKVSNSGLRSSGPGLLRSDSKEFLEKVQQPALSRIFEQKMKEKGDAPQLRSSQDAVTGSRKGLVILANFSDVKFSIANPKDSFNLMLNEVRYSKNGGTGSARDFYIANSKGQFTPDFNVYGPVNLPRSMAFYGENDPVTGNDKNVPQMIIDACQAANTLYPGLNLADYDYDKDGVLDNVFVFFAGYNEAENHEIKPNTIWPQKSSVESRGIKVDGMTLADFACSSELKGSSGTTMAGIGTFTHEFGHVLGLPDLYDADKAVNGEGSGVSYWCTMGAGNYLNESRTPPNFGAMERLLLGWIQPTLLRVSNTTQTITVQPLGYESTSAMAYVLQTPTEDEFFTIECRKRTPGTWDAYIPGEGLLVYHVDFTSSMNKNIKVGNNTYSVSAQDLWSVGWANIVGTHQCFDLLRANNVSDYHSWDDFGGNTYPGLTNVAKINDFTNPGLISWNNQQSGAAITEIQRNSQTGVVSFKLSQKSNANLTEVITNDVRTITQNSAQLQGTISKTGTSSLVERGFCWNKSGKPTVSDTKIIPATASLNYTAALNGLQTDSTYFVRAYVKTADNAVSYGGEVSFKPLSSPQKLPFKEDFKSGKTMNWTILDGDKDYVSWYYTALSTSDGDEIGTAAIIGNDNVANDWIISPPLSIPVGANNVNLTYDVGFTSNQKLAVAVSKTSLDTAAFKTLYTGNYSYSGTGIKAKFNEKVSLSSYTGEKVLIAFINQSNKGDELFLMNVQVYGNLPSGIESPNAALPVIYAENKLIYFSGVSDKYDVGIYDVTGKLYERFVIDGNASKSMDNPGIYIVKLKNGTRSYTYKLIIHANQ